VSKSAGEIARKANYLVKSSKDSKVEEVKEVPK